MATDFGLGPQWEQDLDRLKQAHQNVGSRIPPQHLVQLAGLPEQWRLCATGNRGSTKDCFEERWNSDPAKRYTALGLLAKAEIATTCIGAGVLTGPASGGLLVIDFDEPGDPALDGLAEGVFVQTFGRPSRELPATATNTSGKRGRRKVFLAIPEDWWPEFGNWSLALGPYGHNLHGLELIWVNPTGTSRQAVLAGDHPDSTEDEPLWYRWIDGLHPAVVGVAVAPPWILSGFVKACQRKALRVAITPEEESFDAKRQAGEPQPCDLLLPRDQRRLLLLMQKHWPYRGAPAGSPQDGSYLKANGFRSLVCGLLNVLGKETALAWLGGQSWDRANDWEDGNLGSLEKLLESLARSATDAERKCGWGSIVAAATAGGFEFPKWALPPRELDAADFTTNAAKKVAKLTEALDRINAIDCPTERMACMQELPRILDTKPAELANLVSLLQEQGGTGGVMNEGSMEDVLTKAPVIRPAIENLLAIGAVTMVAADGGVGKSVLIYRVAEAIASGGLFGGKLKATQGNVLVIQKDESAANAANKLRLMNMAAPEGSIRFQFNFHAAMYPELRKWVRDHQATAVVMDSFGSLFGGTVGLGEAEVGLHLYRLNQIASEENVAILLTHHLRKQDKSKSGGRSDVHLSDLFGSSYIVNGASDVWGIWREDPKGATDQDPLFKLKVLKPRTGITEAGDLIELRGSREDLSLTIEAINGEHDGAERLKGVAAKVWKALEGRPREAALDLTELAAATNCHRTYVQRVVTSLFRDATNPGVRRERDKGRSTPGVGKPPFVYWGAEA